MHSAQRHQDRLFDRLAAAYEQHAAVQTEVAERLLGRLDGLRFEPARIVDIGCADGRQCQALHRRFPKARVIGIDRSAGMLARARSRRRWWRRDFELLRADGGRLPLATDSIDLVYANLSLGWLADVSGALLDWRRALRPGGLVLVSMFGPDTLLAQRTRLTGQTRVTGVTDVQGLGAWLVQAGFAEPVLDTDWITTIHRDEAALLADVRGSGLLPAKSRSLGKRTVHPPPPARATDPDNSTPECSATWEIVSASAWSPEAGQAIRSSAGDEASVPVSAIGIRRR